MADGSSPETPDGSSGRSKSIQVTLDGEVMPPTLRLKPNGQDAPRAAYVPPPYRLRLGTALVGVMAALLVFAGVGGGVYAWERSGKTAEPDRTAVALNRLQDDMGKLKAGVDTLHSSTDLARQDEAVRSLKKSVDTLKAELDALKTNNAASMAQISAKLDKTDHDPSPKLTDIASRLDRIEKQVSSPTPTGSIAPAPIPRPTPVSVQQTVATQAVDKPLPKPTTLGSWIVRDVYDGIALVEARQGGIREVAPGEFLPGAGEVRSIERRGRAWVVVTSRGIIDTETW